MPDKPHDAPGQLAQVGLGMLDSEIGRQLHSSAVSRVPFVSTLALA